MHSNTRDVDIAKSLKVIEWLKSELVSSVAALLKAMLRGSEDLIMECITGIIITAYVLGKRLGISYGRIDLNIKNKLRETDIRDHEVEKWYGDLSSFLKYMEDHRR